MNRILSVVALVALSSMAKAEDKASEFKFGGEIRQRYYWDYNPRFLNEKAPTEQHWEQRNQLHVSANSGDKLQAYFNLLHATVWGGTNSIPTSGGPYSQTSGVPNGAGVSSAADHSAQNTFMVHEAWFLWKATDTMLLKSGRMSSTWGDGLVVSRNDWAAVPNNFDGLMGRFSWDFLDLDVGGGKLVDLGISTPNTVTTSGDDTDKEIVFYGLNASIKNLPDFFKKLEFLYIHVNADGMPARNTFLPGYGVNKTYTFDHLGVHTKGEFAIVDYRLDAGMQQGKEKSTTDIAQTGTMVDLDVAVNFPEMMKARFGAGYHMDSGDDTATLDKNEGYQPLFHDQHSYAGNMNIFGFGNLTSARVFASLSPMEDTTVGFAVHMLTRTSDKAGVNILGPNSGNFYYTSAVAAGTDKALGTEYDLWAKHTYGNGLAMMVSISQFSPGSYLKPAGVNVGDARQVMAQAQYNF